MTISFPSKEAKRLRLAAEAQKKEQEESEAKIAKIAEQAMELLSTDLSKSS